MAGPANYNFTLYTGETWSRPLLLTSSGTPWNLTGYTASMQVRDRPGGVLSDTVTCTFATDRTTGIITLSLTPSQSVLFSPGTYFYDFAITSGTGFIYPLLYGEFAVTQRITEWATT